MLSPCRTSTLLTCPLWFDAGELASMLRDSGVIRDELPFDQILEIIRTRLADGHRTSRARGNSNQ